MSPSDSLSGVLPADRFVALSGGIGGAKLALGLARLLGDRLTLVVNTGDDFEHMGLHISPDVDTALYTLADIVNPDTGWGRRNETWSFMAAVRQLGGPEWFNLGDADLATHIDRTQRLKSGETLTSIAEHLRASFGVGPHVLPMSDEPLRTIVESDCGTLGFQEYFVRERCVPAVRRIRFEGADTARPSPAVKAALESEKLRGIILCPSNPWLSINPILAVLGMRSLLRASGVPVVAVSPIIAGQAVKGPTAKIMRELDLDPAAETVAAHYGGLIDGFILDQADAASAPKIPVATTVTRTLMRTLEDKVSLARDCILFCGQLAARSRPGRVPNASAGATP
jgi:LPPG:FO 2-phospho-L-lactate transferase